ncbi:unnamed protein product [Musa acuminata subsp. burmannicoides]
MMGRGRGGKGGGGSGTDGNGGGLARQPSIYSLTFDELQSTLVTGNDFGSMNMDELLKNIWSTEESQAMGAAAPAPVLDGAFAGLQRQGSLTLPRTLSQKTVDQVWRDLICPAQQGMPPAAGVSHQHRQPTLGEMTLEEFLVRAGAVRDELAPPQTCASNSGNNSSSKNNNNAISNVLFHDLRVANNVPQLALGFPQAGRSDRDVVASNPFTDTSATNLAVMVATGPSPYVAPMAPGDGFVGMGNPRAGGLVGIGDVGINNRLMPGAVGLGAAGGAGAVGTSVSHLPSDAPRKHGADLSSVSPVPYVVNGGLRGKKSSAVDNFLERRQRRMIKNRESAARSRDRKQAYTMKLEAEVAKLQELNQELNKKQAELTEMQKDQGLRILDCYSCSFDTLVIISERGMGYRRRGGGGGGGPPPFLVKTYEMVEESGTDEMISWGKKGESFVVWKPAEFARDLLPLHFKHNNFSSFVRQLNTYVVAERWEFTNDNFRREEKKLLRNIHRRKPASEPRPSADVKSSSRHEIRLPPSSTSNSWDRHSSSSASSPPPLPLKQPLELANENEKLRKDHYVLNTELDRAKCRFHELLRILSKYVDVSQLDLGLPMRPAAAEAAEIGKKEGVEEETLAEQGGGIKVFGVLLKGFQGEEREKSTETKRLRPWRTAHEDELCNAMDGNLDTSATGQQQRLQLSSGACLMETVVRNKQLHRQETLGVRKTSTPTATAVAGATPLPQGSKETMAKESGHLTMVAASNQQQQRRRWPSLMPLLAALDWSSCPMDCKFGFANDKVPDAAFGLPQNPAVAGILRRGYKVVMTTSLSSDVPVGYFSWAEYDIMTPMQPKTEEALAAAFISNCGARNFRLQALTMLEESGIKIDSYGSCHRNRDGNVEKVETLKRYKFSLAFENSNEEDYVTEKFFQSLVAGTVPVVIGAPNIQDFAPSPDSILHIKEISDIDSVAKSIRYLATNSDAYNHALRWKHEGPSDSFKALVDMAAVHSSCRLCIHLATKIQEIEEKSAAFQNRSCSCTSNMGTVYHLFVRERGRFKMESIYLRSGKLTLKALESAILAKFRSLNHTPIWKNERPTILRGGNDLKIHRIYPVGITQREALYTFRFNNDAELEKHIKSNPCAKLEVIFV